MSGRLLLVAGCGGEAIQVVFEGTTTNLAGLAAAPGGIALADDGSMAVALNGTVPEILRLAADGTPLNHYQSGLSGFCMGVEIAAFPVGTSPVPTLQWCATVTGPFVDDTGAAVDPGSRTITVTRRDTTALYRLRASKNTRIRDFRLDGTEVVITYE